jgi:hypothetical protein
LLVVVRHFMFRALTEEDDTYFDTGTGVLS